MDETADGRRGLRGAALATFLLFAANGAVFGAIVPRLPDLKDSLGLGDAAFGLAMACFPAGALFGGLVAPALFRRSSDGFVAVMSMAAASVVGGLLGFAPGALAFAGLLVAFGVCDAITDVAMNAHGIRVQGRLGRSLINRFHAVWSLGAVAGGGVGAAAAGIGAPVTVQMALTGAVCVALSLVVLPLRLPGHGPAPAAEGTALSRLRGVPASVWWRIGGLGLLACCATLAEDFAQNWSALYLRDVAAASAGVAGLGFIAVQGMQLVGRLTGDRLTERHGAARIGRLGGICVTVGAGAVLVWSFAFSSVPVAVALVGFGLVGWGIATVIPGAMVASDASPGLPTGVGLSALNWVLRIGFLASPPLVGLIAEHAGMRWSVAPMAAGGLVILVLSGRLLGGVAAGDPVVSEEATA